MASATTPTSYITSLFSLEGHTAIVTGATGGLGTSMTLALAKAGANIITIELPADPLSESLATALADVGVKHSKFECDVRDANSLRACYGRIWESLEGGGLDGQPDILLNCAGVMRRNKCEDATDEEMDLVSFFGPCPFSCNFYSFPRVPLVYEIASPWVSSERTCLPVPQM